MGTVEENRYQAMVGNRWIWGYLIITILTVLVFGLCTPFVRQHIQYSLPFLFFGPPVLAYVFVPSRREWRRELYVKQLDRQEWAEYERRKERQDRLEREAARRQ